MAKYSLLQTAAERGYITEDQYRKAEAYKVETGVADDVVFRDTKILSEEKVLELYNAIYGYPVERDPEVSDGELSKRFSRQDLIKYGFFPVRDGQDILIYSAQPGDLLYAEDMIRDETGYRGVFQYGLVTNSALNNLIQEHFGTNTPVEMPEFEGGELFHANIYDISETDSSAVVNFVNNVFRTAVERGISDIHFEPQEDALYIRFREDGTLKQAHVLPIQIARPVINRIKTMANMDVNNSKIIQDGNIRLEMFGKAVDLRVSVIPAVNGENMVVRILDQNKMRFDISMLGFSAENEEKFKKLIRRPQGIILLTGPTGSGKSTSLYAALSVLNAPDKCIITFEDPVEYRIPGIVQVQINPAMDVTFPQALKSGLRQDIEVALVGEIRDAETAAIAFDEANTGHMVFSTLHTNSAASSIMRLVKMGIEPYIVSRTLVAVINQRLVKRICPHCREEYMLEADSPFRKVLNCGDNPVRLYRGKGCKKCGGEGYLGRIAVQEFLVVNEEIRELLDRGALTAEIEEAAIKNGMKKIHEDGIEKALAGITTLEEIHRTVFFDEI